MAQRLLLLRALAALACVFAFRAHPVAAQSTRPNIIVITTDDAGYNDFGFMAAVNGHPTDVQTPNLDALANQSMVLSSGYANGPICSPSRAALLTGQYQQRFGYEENPGHRDGLPAGQQLISHQLKNLGYSTGAIGKWHMGETVGVNRPLDAGFDEFFGFYWGGRPFFDYTADGSRAIRRGNDNVDSLWAEEGDQTRYDPQRGRYLTDAFGEESAAFINNHATHENPFFLYVSLHGPHVPLEAKQSDLDLFADIADPNRQKIAAMTYAVDRAVGDITSALDANGIADDTIIVFMNDNGGPSTAPYDNGPLHGNKGSLWEGGIRVPFMIKAPGLDGGVYDEPVAAIDVLPTLVNAAGGNASQTSTDGTDLMPFLSGEVAGDPHELMFWRSAGGRYAVRKGDWKLVRPGTSTFARLHNVADDIDESNFFNSQHPELVEELHRELTFWEATLEKPKWGVFGEARNHFDHFVFRSELATNSSWSLSGYWTAAGTSNVVRLTAEDAYANAILEFRVRNDANYTATNNMRRSTNQTFMLNQVRFTGDFAGTANRTGTVNGNALLFVKSLSGELPRIQLDSTATTANRFSHHFDNDIQLLDDLEITGDGTQDFVISGDISDYHEPRRVTKSGTSSVTLAGNNTFSGGLTINGGRVNTSNITGDVLNNGGTFAPGPTRSLVNIAGDYAQTGGVLEIELGGASRGTTFDSLVVAGDVQFSGTLLVSLADGFIPLPDQSFQVLDWAGSLSGAFAAIDLPVLESHLGWNTSRLYTTGRVSVEFVQLPGDLNGDNSNDAADFVVWSKWQSQFAAWQAQFGKSAPGDNAAPSADLNGDSVVDVADYVMWRKLAPNADSWQTFFGESIADDPPLLGDLNADGTIDAADYVMWRKTDGPNLDYKAWLASYTRATLLDTTGGDLNGDGAVDAADYVAWRKTSGTSADFKTWLALFGNAPNASGGQSSQSGVPEPSTLLSLIIALALGWLGQRLRCRPRSAAGR